MPIVVSATHTPTVNCMTDGNTEVLPSDLFTSSVVTLNIFCKSSKTWRTKYKNNQRVVMLTLQLQTHSLPLLSVWLLMVTDSALCVYMVHLILNLCFLTWMLNSNASTASFSTAALCFPVSSMLFMRLLYSCLKRLGLLTPGKEKNESPSLLLSPRDFWVIFPST